MEKRWARATLVAWFILFVAGSHGLARSVSWKHTHHRHKADEKASVQELAAGVATIHRRGCRFKNLDLVCGHLTQAYNHGISVDDDKRLRNLRHVSSSGFLEQGQTRFQSRVLESFGEEEGMEKDGQIRVRRRPTKRRRSRVFVKVVADYLASDCYMYAPLLDVPPPDFPPSSAASSPPATGLIFSSFLPLSALKI
ncbi:hypothetical protein GW17_00038888 [Ensete ventricosum]|nr:hypothetical protein GW17_00038888 [Ensete ventricosum]